MCQSFIQKTLGYFEHYFRVGRCYGPSSFKYLQGDIVIGTRLSRLNLAGVGVKIYNRCLGIMAIPRQSTQTASKDDRLSIDLDRYKSLQ